MPIEPRNKDGDRIKPQQQFTISSEKVLENRTAAYSLNQDETAQIWQTAAERDQSILEAKNEFQDNRDDLIKDEIERLRGEEQPRPVPRPRPAPAPGLGGGRVPANNNTPRNYTLEAENNVELNHAKNLDGIRQDADQKIDGVLDNARNEGRGPDLEPTREFNQAVDRDPPGGR